MSKSKGFQIHFDKNINLYYLRDSSILLPVVFDMLTFRGLCIAVTCAVLLVPKLNQAELDEQLSPVVQTESGAVVGKIDTLPQVKSVHEYLGIPYAEPPIGGLRFAPPERVKPWPGIRNATEYGASCPQSLVSASGTSLEGSGMFIYLIENIII